MPLVVPGVTNTGVSTLAAQEEWQNKLLGKTLTTTGATNETEFSVAELPQKHRIIQPGQNITRDHQEDRLNVHVGEDGTVHVITFG